jgi:DNA-binding NarL/FixJ family response regulator
MKIFIVDDSAIVVERLKTLIAEIEGLEHVGSAANARDAVESILSLTPDIVILDIRLSGENGISVLERIKKEQLTPITIMLTNYPYPQYRKKCRELRADYFFDKVTDFEEFITLLRRLARVPSQRELPL